ncbi:DUF2623 family protein [Achromobacter xylosoxidans]
MTNNVIFDAGYKAGESAVEAPEDPFDMSTFHDDYKIGFILGFSDNQGGQGHPIMAASTAGELTCRYAVSRDQLLSHVKFDSEQLERFQESWEDERKAQLEAFREEEED